MRGISNLIKFLLLRNQNRFLYKLFVSGYLHDTGYILSSQKNEVLFSDGSPAPWYTFPFIQFLENRFKEHFNVFEYGIGNSTLYYLAKTSNIYGVDHDKTWYHKILSNVPEELHHQFYLETGEEGYLSSIAKANKKFHMIIIDGIYRDKCLENALSALDDKGVIIVDNSENPEVQKLKERLILKDFKEIPFFGLQSLGYQSTCTSIFYRDRNCLGI